MYWTKRYISAVLAAVVILFLPQSAGAATFEAGNTISGNVTDGLTSDGAAGTLTIDSTGVITNTTGGTAVLFSTFPWTLNNSGRITGTARGVQFFGQGTLNNLGTDTLITGPEFGVFIGVESGTQTVIGTINNGGSNSDILAGDATGTFTTGAWIGGKDFTGTVTGIINNSGLNGSEIGSNTGDFVTGAWVGTMMNSTGDINGDIFNTADSADIFGTNADVNATGAWIGGEGFTGIVTGVVTNSGSSSRIYSTEGTTHTTGVWIGGFDFTSTLIDGTVTNSGLGSGSDITAASTGGIAAGVWIGGYDSTSDVTITGLVTNNGATSSLIEGDSAGLYATGVWIGGHNFNTTNININGVVTNSGAGNIIQGLNGATAATGVWIGGFDFTGAIVIDGTVDNTGDGATIFGDHYGVRMGSNGAPLVTGLVNNSGIGSVIEGGDYGVWIEDTGVAGEGLGTVNNTGDGSLIRGGMAGVFIENPAIVTNSNGSIIEGGDYGVRTGSSDDTVSSGGRISGLFEADAGTAAIFTGAGNDTINLQNGAEIFGDIDGGANTLDDIVNLSGSGTFGDLFLDIETLFMNGTDWTLFDDGTGSTTHEVGDTQVDGGILRIIDEILDGTASVNSGGTLTGNGEVTGTVTTSGAGAIAPGDSGIGTFRVLDLDMTGGGNLEIEFGLGPNNNDLLEVFNGPNVTGGTVTFLPTVGGLDGETFTFIVDPDMDTTATGPFANIAISPLFLTPVISFNAGGCSKIGDVCVTINRDPAGYLPLANTPNRTALAGVLGAAAVGPPTGDLAIVIAAIESELTLEGFQAALDQLSPAEHASLARIKLQEVRYFKDTLIQRLWDLRTAEIFKDELAEQGINVAMANMDPALFARVLKDMNAQKIGAPTGWRTFIKGYGVISQLNDEADLFGFNSRAVGLSFGLDRAITRKLSVGAAIGFSNTHSVFYNNDTFADTRTFHLAGYGQYNGEALYLDGALVYGYNWFEMDRSIVFNIIDRVAVSDHTGGHILTHLGGGYDFRLGKWVVGPVASMEFLGLYENGFEEEGAGAANLDIDSADSTSFRSTLGVRAAMQVNIDHNLFVPEVHVRWAHEYLDDHQTVQSQFTSIPGASFTVIDRELPADSLLVGGGVTGFHNNVAVNLNYDVEFGRSDFLNHIINIGINFSF